MLLTFMLLIVATLAPAQPTIVTPLTQTQGYTTQFQPNVITGEPLQPAQPTIVTTWSIN